MKSPNDIPHDADTAFLRIDLHEVRKASAVVDLATISLLVDAGIVSVDQAAERIEHIRSVLLGGQDQSLANRTVRLTIETLRQIAPEAAPSPPRGSPSLTLLDGGRKD